MKSLFLLLSLFAVSGLSAQYNPNYSFENWVDDTTAVSWNKVSGRFVRHDSVVVILQQDTFRLYPAVDTTFAGLGDPDTTVNTGKTVVISSYPDSIRPSVIVANVAYRTQGNRSFAITLLLTGGGDTVLYKKYTPAQGSMWYPNEKKVIQWAQVLVHVEASHYRNSNKPDQVVIILESTGEAASVAGEVLYVDQLMLLDHQASIGKNTLQKGFRVFPNPSHGPVVLDITLPKPGNISTEVFDMQGRRVLTAPGFAASAGKNNVPLDLSGLSEGMYLLKVETPAGSAMSKVVIQP